jgi:hypothetical protein
MNDHLQEMAARAQKAGLSGLFQVTKSVGVKESIPSSEDWRNAPKQLPEFLNACVKDSGATSAEAFVLGPDLGPVSLRNPMLIPDVDLEDLKKWFGFYSRAFRLRQYTDDPHPQTTLQKKSAELITEVADELITEVAEFVASRLRGHGVKKPF